MTETAVNYEICKFPGHYGAEMCSESATGLSCPKAEASGCDEFSVLGNRFCPVESITENGSLDIISTLRG